MATELTICYLSGTKHPRETNALNMLKSLYPLFLAMLTKHLKTIEDGSQMV